jgi:1,2-diacylglycerol 3-alpha-glucosyltransferase
MAKSTAIDKSDFCGWMSSNRIDIVIFNEQRWWYPLIWCAELGVKTVAYIDYYTEETIPLFGVYDALICNTRRHYSAFAWHPRAHFVPWGTEVDVFRPSDAREAKQGPVVFFHSAGMNPIRKGTDLVVSAFWALPEPKKLVIHTQVDLRKRMPGLVKILESLEAEGSLEIVQKSVKAPGLYSLGDVYLYPSRLDGIGLSLVEALACGLPVITSDNPPMNEFCDADCCMLVEIERQYARPDGYYWPQCEASVPALARAMSSWSVCSDRLLALQKEAREYAERNLDWKKNGCALPRLVADLEARPIEEKRRIFTAIEEFERKTRTPEQIAVDKIPLLYLFFWARRIFG